MLKLAIERREVFGKKLKSAREAGKLPVIVYGTKTESTPYFVSAKEFGKVFAKAGESTVISLVPAGEGASKEVLVQDVALGPVSDKPVHVDFYVIDKAKAIEVEVPLHFEGVAPAVKDHGGTLVRVLHNLSIEALPLEIPHNIVVDVTTLTDLDSQILVKDLKLPAGVKELLNDPEEVVASISVAKEEEDEAPQADLADIEVGKKGKREDDTKVAPSEGGSEDKGDKAEKAEESKKEEGE
ncbi:MAG: 50S ribosomal protein L25 [Patescibacteria group bacterium]|nr:50S ribosomal protein L25 [Patescibacteria group bacterium]